MKKFCLLFIVLLVLSAQWFPLSFAQDDSTPPRLFAVLETHIKPGWVPVYESAVIDLQDIRDEQKISWPLGPIVSLNETPSYFHFFPPLGELNELARLQTLFSPKGNEDWDRLIAKIQVSKNSETWWVVRERPDLSYHPNHHAIVFGKESQYFNMNFFSGLCGMEKEIDAAFKEWIELYATNEIPYGYTVFEAVLGGELPLLIFVYNYPSPAEFYQSQMEISAKLGYKEAKMMEKVLKLCRTYTVRTGFYRPELTGWKEWGK